MGKWGFVEQFNFQNEFSKAKGFFVRNFWGLKMVIILLRK